MKTPDQNLLKRLDDRILDYHTARDEAERLARKLHERHYGYVIGWHPASDLTGLIVQINQMTHGLVKRTSQGGATPDATGGVV